MPQNPSPESTPRSTGPSPARRSEILRALKALILVAALVWVGYMAVDAVRDVREGNLQLEVRAGWLAASAAIILLTYLILIRSWLYILTGLSGQSISFLLGARIWFISSLGTLLPGRIWGIVQMGAMSAAEGVSPVAAGAASVINAAVNIATGLAVGVIAGAPLVAAYSGRPEWMAWSFAGLAIVGVCLLPVLLPFAFRFARDRFGASAPAERPPARVIIVSALANMLAWVLYGAAFLCLSKGLIPGVGGDLWDHTSVFATSYVIGYLFIFTPAGLGAREAALIYVLLASALATPSQAQALSVTSRLWLLIIQVLPALIFLAYRRPRNDKVSAG